MPAVVGLPSKPALEAGDVIAGRYEVERLIGRGGMGEVYAARNRGTGRSVALKIIRSSDVSDEQRRRFLREAKTATAISHPNVIDVLDVFEDEDGSPVMVMELLRGEPLSALLKGDRRPELGQIAAILLPVAHALQEAHDKGIVHRDLKPDNIFIGSSSGGALVPKVLDFGIAKVLDSASVAETQGSQTNTGSILGTPQYMSFEQAMSEKDIDHRADIWAFGVILFEAVTGRRPFEFENLGQMYTQFLQGEVPAVRDHAPDLPAGLADAIDHCLRKDRAERATDLGEVIEALERHADQDALVAIATALGDASLSTVTGKTQGNFEAPSIQRPGSRAPVWLGLVAVVLVGTGIWWLLGSTSSAVDSGVEPPAPTVATTSSSVELSSASARRAVASAGAPTGSLSASASATGVAATASVTAPPARPTTVGVRPPVATASPQTSAQPATSAAPTATGPKRIVDDLPY